MFRNFTSSFAQNSFIMPSTDNHPMAFKQQRNFDYQPFIGDEGEFRTNLPQPPSVEKDSIWYEGLPSHARMHFHQTLSSARRFVGFGAYPNKVPVDSLDLVLQSQYHHGKELFAGKPHIVLQPETMGRRTFRRIRNTRDLTPERVIAIGHPLAIGELDSFYSFKFVVLI